MVKRLRVVSAVRGEILSAVGGVRSVARSEHDSAREQAAGWLDGLFTGVTTRQELRVAAKQALGLWGGMGSFSDAGSPGSADAVDRLRVALRRARSWLVRPG